MSQLLLLSHNVAAVAASIAPDDTSDTTASTSSLSKAGLTTMGAEVLSDSRPTMDSGLGDEFGLGSSLYDLDYDDLHLTKYHNISGEQWLNYSCQNMEVAATGFLKNFVEPIICCSGILGILLTMVVLTRKNMCTSCNCYLTALAVGDLLFLLIMSARFLADKFADCHFHVSDESVVFLVYSIIVQDICLYLTVGVTVMLAVERYIAICHPMRAMGMCTVKRARIIIVALTLVAFILRSPKFMDIEFSYATSMTGEKILTVTWVYPYNDAVYTYIVTVCLLTVLPLLTLLILNVRIIQEIRRSSRYLQYYLGADWRVRSVVSTEELKITMMLIGVVVAFFACHVPYMIYSVMVAFMEFDTAAYNFLTNSIELKYFKHVCHTLLALRSSCNFLLYCWFSEKFWTNFKRIFSIPHCFAKQSSLRPNGFNNNGRHSRFNSHTNLHRSSYYITRETTC